MFYFQWDNMVLTKSYISGLQDQLSTIQGLELNSSGFLEDEKQQKLP